MRACSAGRGVYIRRMKISLSVAFAASLLFPAGAFAQAVPSSGSEPGVFDGDFLVIGVGVAAVPSYEGSNDTAIIPAAGVIGRIAGIGISPRAAGAALNFVPARKGAKVTFQLGPVVRYRDDRVEHIKDPVVRLLGERKGTVEAGVATGLTVQRVLNPYDSLGLGIDVRRDTAGHGGARFVSVSSTYLTPVSHAQIVGLSGSAEFVSDGWADYHYSITPAGSAASGLPVYQAKGGMKSWGLRLFSGYDLDGNLLNGGFSLVAGVSYTRLAGSAAATPITSLRGSRDQWAAAAGLAYVF